jgi:hypothetical protein
MCREQMDVGMPNIETDIPFTESGPILRSERVWGTGIDEEFDNDKYHLRDNMAWPYISGYVDILGDGLVGINSHDVLMGPPSVVSKYIEQLSERNIVRFSELIRESCKELKARVNNMSEPRTAGPVHDYVLMCMESEFEPLDNCFDLDGHGIVDKNELSLFRESYCLDGDIDSLCSMGIENVYDDETNTYKVLYGGVERSVGEWRECWERLDYACPHPAMWGVSRYYE